MAINKTAKAKNNFKTLENCGIIAKRTDGSQLKLQYGQWFDNEPVYDLRPWKGDTSFRGITLTGEELETLGKLILSMMEEPKAKATKETKETKPKATTRRRKVA